jgi:hypothetical protein
MSTLKAETTTALRQRIMDLEVTRADLHRTGSRLTEKYTSGKKNGLQECASIALERDARDAELADIRALVEPHRGESLTKAVKRWVYNAKNNERQLGLLRKEMAS